MNAKRIGGLLVSVAFFAIMGLECWNECVTLWNELLLWAVGIGEMSAGFIVPQVIWFTVVGALLFSTVVGLGNWALGRVLD